MKLTFSSSPLQWDDTVHLLRHQNDGVQLHAISEDSDADENVNSDNYDLSSSPPPSPESEQPGGEEQNSYQPESISDDLQLPFSALDTESSRLPITNTYKNQEQTGTHPLQQSLSLLMQLPKPNFNTERQSFTRTKNASDTSPRKQLRSSVEQLKVNSRPLTPYNGLCANDVYIEEAVVLKPGVRSAVAAVLSYKIARLIKLAGTDLQVPATIPMTLKGSLPTLTSRDDADIEYEIIEINRKKYAVNMEVCTVIERNEDGTITFITDQQEYCAIPENSGYKVQHTKTGSQHPSYGYNLGNLIEIDDITYIIPQDGYYSVDETEQGYTFVRDSITYTLEPCERDGLASDSEDDESIPLYHAVAKNAFGTIQERVNNLVSTRKTRGRNQTEAEPAQTDIINKIDSKSFINAFLMSMLVRPEDGKAQINGESNYLFTHHQNAIYLAMIDLDEAWPANNQYKEENHQEITNKSHLTARLHLGLMGFDLAHKPLAGADREHFNNLINEILAAKPSMLALIAKYVAKYPDSFGNPGIAAAFEETLSRLERFQGENKENSFSLASLCFSLFPTYLEQWEALATLGIKKEVIAANVGLLSLDKIKERLNSQ